MLLAGKSLKFWITIALATTAIVGTAAAVVMRPVVRPEAQKASQTDSISKTSATGASSSASESASATKVTSPTQVGTAQSGSGAPGSQTGSGATTGGTTASKGFYLRLYWWNDTSAKPTADVVIEVGGKRFSPNATVRSQVGKIGPLKVGTKLQGYVYPDGIGGTKIPVSLTITSSMLSDAERDAMHVELSDAKVKILGNPVENFELLKDRY